MKKCLLLAGWMVSFSLLQGQTQLSGTINHYAKILEFDTCQNSLLVHDAFGFLPGTRAIILQMKGAQINASNSGNFGTITDPGQAGLYEIAAIRSVNSNRIVLENRLLNHYRPEENVQLISFPQYENATITGELTATPWDGQTGGVLALEVLQTLTLQANIEVSGKGFRGGQPVVATGISCNFLTANNRYAYEAGNWRGAPKGEGVAAPLPGQEYGRGAQSNGGGGGNNHNAGGGGGGHFTAGGKGGENREPSLGGCDGFFPGEGGKAIPSAPGRLFFGGGGGAGHLNNENAGTGGGNGGGIVLLIAGSIEGNGFHIRADGHTPPKGNGDGAGGGGAGGTIILQAGQLTGSLYLSAEGGQGGSIDNLGAERCHGPGGGGSGGRILIRPDENLISPSVAGGDAGQTIRSGSCSDGNNGAEAGKAGLIEILPILPESKTPFLEPSIVHQPEQIILCDGQTVRIPVDVSGQNLSLQWQADFGNGFTDLTDAEGYSGTQSTELILPSVGPAFSGSRFRLVVRSSCFSEKISAPILLNLQPFPEAGFYIHQEELSVRLENRSSGADQFFWDFGDGTTSPDTAPAHEYPEPGTYVLTLIATSSCGNDTLQQTITLALPPFAGFLLDSGAGCAPHQVRFSNRSTGTYDSLQWVFPGGTPAESTEKNPVITYSTPGFFDVSLYATGLLGTDTLIMEKAVVVVPFPQPAFSFEVQDRQTLFTNRSQNASHYRWDFGDGQTSEEEHPVHTFSGSGTYNVTLNALNSYCGKAISQTVAIILTDVTEPAGEEQFLFFPNPVSTWLSIADRSGKNQLVQSRLWNAQGEEVMRQEWKGQTEMDVSGLPNGFYILEVKKEALMVRKKVLIAR